MISQRDVVLAVDGYDVQGESIDRIAEILARCNDDEVDVLVFRAGQKVPLKVPRDRVLAPPAVVAETSELLEEQSRVDRLHSITQQLAESLRELRATVYSGNNDMSRLSLPVDLREETVLQLEEAGQNLRSAQLLSLRKDIKDNERMLNIEIAKQPTEKDHAQKLHDLRLACLMGNMEVKMLEETTSQLDFEDAKLIEAASDMKGSVALLTQDLLETERVLAPLLQRREFLEGAEESMMHARVKCESDLVDMHGGHKSSELVLAGEDGGVKEIEQHLHFLREMRGRCQ